jgi:uncharacterized protein
MCQRLGSAAIAYSTICARFGFRASDFVLRRILLPAEPGRTLPGMTMPDESPADSPADSTAAEARKWQPLSSRQRRVLGVLIEKAKTTPDVYPMTVNGIVAGSNQKSNREPQMSLSSDDVEQILSELRAVGCVTEVQGSGRVPKYRHHAYEWLGVEKTELAVMTELLLRGEQTLGELRGRAARMEPIADLTALKPIVDSLVAKGLMVELSPAGRGQVVSHSLYKPREIEELRAQFAGYVPPPSPEGDDARPATQSHATPPPRAASQPAIHAVTADQFADLEVEVAELRAEMARLKDLVGKLDTRLSSLMG